jgi:hypothetical protein
MRGALGLGARADEVELREQPRDRRAQLVRGVRDEAHLRALRLAQPREHVVQLALAPASALRRRRCR